MLIGTFNDWRQVSARDKLPAVYWERFFVAAGGLVAYGPDLAAFGTTRKWWNAPIMSAPLGTSGLNMRSLQASAGFDPPLGHSSLEVGTVPRSGEDFARLRVTI